MPDGIVFNRELALDLMFLDKKAVLHVVDTQTHFSAAAFLKQQTIEHVWYAFLMCWAAIYTGLPDEIKVDQGGVITSQRWKGLIFPSLRESSIPVTDMTGIELSLSGVESHNSLGAGEGNNDPLRRIYNKIRFSHLSIDEGLSLKLATKAMNDTMNPEGFIPSLLVFGVLPRFPPMSTELPNQVDRMRALEVARAEIEQFTSEIRIKKALIAKIPSAATAPLAVN